MIKTMTKKMNNKKGFTLIELIVVIAILGILAAIAIPRFANVNRNAERSAVEANLKTIESAIQIAIAGEDDADIDTVAKMKAVITADYLQEWPDSPGSYDIGGTDGDKSTYRAIVTVTIGSETETDASIEELSWR